MALQSSGPISFSEISSEFGTPPGRNLGAYRISTPEQIGALPAGLPLDTGIPQSGSISFSDFYSKKLNIIVDFYSITSGTVRRNARNRYDNNNVVVIGGFRTRPSSSSGTKVYVNVNTTIGSEKGNRNNVALRTGSWDANTELITIIGSNGKLYGAGGNGGSGGGTSFAQSSASQGGQGTSGFGIDYPTSLINQGLIFGGRGGGGGGSGAYGWNYNDTQDGCEGKRDQSRRVGGAGGAGGRGYPAGNGGAANTQYVGPAVTFASDGTSGSIDSNGSGGAKGYITGCGGGEGNCDRRPHSGVGGAIESSGGRGQAIRTRGGDCSIIETIDNNDYNNQGSGGQRGYAIIIGPSGSLDTVPGHNAPTGDTINDTVA